MYIHYKDEPVNAVEGGQIAMHVEAHKHCVWVECSVFMLQHLVHIVTTVC
jgi:hypothetical protein